MLTLTPSSDAQAIDHGGVAVSAHQAVRIEHAFTVEYHTTQVLQVHLQRAYRQ